MVTMKEHKDCEHEVTTDYGLFVVCEQCKGIWA